MTSLTLQRNSATEENKHDVDVKESTRVTTIQRIYRADNDDDIVVRDPATRRSFINKTAYAKLHRSLSSGGKRHSVDNLKGRFENPVKQDTDQRGQLEIKSQNSEVAKEPTKQANEEEETKFTPASFGYPKTAKLVPPLIKPKPTIWKKPPKDENSNLVNKNRQSSDVEEISIVLQPAPSQESIYKIAQELSNFTMDGKPKERKRVNSFRKLFTGGLFGKDKKKKEVKYGDNLAHNDNMRNESNFVRQSPQRQTIPKPNVPVNSYNDQNQNKQQLHEEKAKELEKQYAELHVNRFNQIKQTFGGERTQDYLPMDNKKKPSTSDYISVPINKYIDTSSSASTESEKPNGSVARDTPPRAQETYQNFKMVKPKASIPINSERPLPNPYQNEKTSPRTIERNLNKTDGKDYPDKPTYQETYGTVFDSLEYAAARNGEIKPINSQPLNSPNARNSPNSPKSPSLESSKLKLPPNREIYDPQPRVKSPIPSNRVSADKIIATELLRSARSPTPPKRTLSRKSDEVVVAKPPLSPKVLERKPSDSSINLNQSDRIVTNADVHAPQRAQTPLDNRTYSNLSIYRSSTPVELRMKAAQKHSPQKEDIRKSVEEYYWKELKKLKEEEDSKLYSIQVMNGYVDEAARVRRSRSLSPSSRQVGGRSLSLTRDGRGVYVDTYGRVPHQPIPEERALIMDGQVSRQLVYDQNFIRNTPERRSDSLQRPIFRRGSLTRQEIYESQPYNKRVSFSNSQQPVQQNWVRNGFNQNPPRRLERGDSDPLDDEVFYQGQQLYAPRLIQNDPVYSNRVLEQFRAQQAYDLRRQQQQLQSNYEQQIGPRRVSMDSIPRSRPDYVIRNPVVRRPVSNLPPNIANDYGRIQQYPSNSQLSLQHNPVYSSRQSITDSNYGQKQVTMQNKYADMYGQIHDAPQSGIVMGQLQRSKMSLSRQAYTQPAPENFVRGSRLTASANDVGKRYDSRYAYETNYDTRPLPPPPLQKKPVPISDTESGSDVSEIQRIMQSKSKSKKRGLFGK